jgi:arsenite methyltransferase
MKNYLTHSFSTDDFDLVSVIDELPLWSAPFGLRLLDAVELRSHVNALDIGCGFGFPLIEIAQRLGTSSKIFGIDPWARAIERAHLKINKYGIENVEVIKGVAERLPFADNSFDLIVSNNGINNVQDIVQTLSECYRTARLGAQFLMTANLEDSMIEFYAVLEETLAANGMDENITRMKDHIYSKRKPLKEMENMLESAGFKIKSVHQDSFRMNFLDATAMFNHSLIKYWFLDGWKSVVDQDDLAKVFDQVEERLDAIARKKRELILTIPYVTIDCRKDPV